MDEIAGAAEAAHRGVRWSGLGPDPAIRLTATQAAAAAARAAHDLTWMGSPQKTYLEAVASLDELGWAAEAQRARQALDRGFATVGRAPVPREVGVALKLLNAVPHSDARAAIDALADLLLSP